MNSADANPTFVPNAGRSILDLYVLTVLFCALIAAVLTLPAPGFAGFARWLLIVECIGITGTTIGTLVSQIPWLHKQRPLVAHVYISSIAIPTGYLVGSSLAYTLLAEPIPIFQAGVRPVIALIATALASSFIVYLDAMRQRITEEASQRAEAQRLAAESQLRLLRAQLEPHMLFNTLSNLRSLVALDAKAAQSMIDQLIVYLRSTLAATREQSASLRAEFAQLRAYLEIMSLRMGSRMRFRLELPEALQDITVPPMLLQPLVENAIKHGIEPKIGPGEIDVTARLDDDGIEIAVTDTGLGLPLESDVREGHTTSTRYGLEHVRDRLRTFYGPNASLTLERRVPQGVRALVRIPR